MTDRRVSHTVHVESQASSCRMFFFFFSLGADHRGVSTENPTLIDQMPRRLLRTVNLSDFRCQFPHRDTRFGLGQLTLSAYWPMMAGARATLNLHQSLIQVLCLTRRHLPETGVDFPFLATNHLAAVTSDEHQKGKDQSEILVHIV